jgi:LPS-assembly lipoprotein
MKSRASLLIALAAPLAALALAACGFTPLYAVPGTSPGLASIEVHAPHGRTAYLVGQALNDAFGHSYAAPPVYRLDFTVGERRYQRGLRINNVATLYETQIVVGYQLTDIATGRLIKRGGEPVQVVYDVADQPYAGVAAQQNSQERAANEVAERIRADLAIYFTTMAKQK